MNATSGVFLGRKINLKFQRTLGPTIRRRWAFTNLRISKYFLAVTFQQFVQFVNGGKEVDCFLDKFLYLYSQQPSHFFFIPV